MTIKVDHVLDAKGLSCPLPIIRTKKAIEGLRPGQVVEVQATDRGSLADLQSWANSTGHQYLGSKEEGNVLKHYIRKSNLEETREEISYPHIVTNDELQKKLERREDITLIDVREPAEYAFNHIPGATSIPLGELESACAALDPDDAIFVICRSGNRSDLAARMLTAKGFKNVRNVIPGMSAWQGPTEKIQNEESTSRKNEGKTPYMKEESILSTAYPLTSNELAKRIIHRQKLFVLDVRNEADFANWRIEGEHVEVLNIPYFELIDEVEPALQKIPDGKEVVVVCAKEGSSKFVADQLVEAGKTDVYYLTGGMKAWSEHLEPIKIGDLKDGGSIYQFVRMGKGCLSYLIESGGEVVIVDANRMIEQYEAFAVEKGLKIKHLIDTHVHADHISGGRKLAEKVNASYWLPPKDAAEVTFAYNRLEEGQNIKIGDTSVTIKPLYSPGHTIGSTSLIIDDQYLLTGDILFVDSIGRPDLAGHAEAWAPDLRHTLYRLYKELDGELIVLPAHYSKISEMNENGSISAKLGDLYEQNDGLKITDDASFRTLVTENLPPQPNAYQEIRQTNMGKIQPSEEEQREMEIGPNRCAVS